MEWEAALSRARAIIDGAERVEVFTGAGMSADSGLRTYRDADSGLWENVDPEAMASIDAWARDPETMWRWYLARRAAAAEAQPNAGHKALKGYSVTTQNIDNLHERGGASDVIHLHGSLFEFRCCICARPWRGPVTPEEIPACPLCGNLVRPGVVWFGEPLPPREWDAAEERMRRADVVVVVGTSGIVYPAAGLPLLAAQEGARIIEVTLQDTPLSATADVVIRARAAEALPALLPQRTA